MKLYCFGESGHSYKAALALQLAEIDWTPIFVDFFNGETRSDQYR
ncbi:MAG: glutathione S-transferase, partial [Rhodobacteraceae bacterium]|nr:glutathione S-transferase [Paracoccaceae bacterium]